MSENLYELTNEFKELESMDFDKDSQVYIDTLDGIKQSIQSKGNNICLVLANLKSNTVALDNEIKRLQAVKRARQNNIDSLRSWLSYNMENSGIDKISSDLFTITLSKAPKDSLVIIEDDGLIPIDYKEVKYTVNKTAVKRALKDGFSVKGAKLVDGARRLLIK